MARPTVAEVAAHPAVRALLARAAARAQGRSAVVRRWVLLGVALRLGWWWCWGLGPWAGRSKWRRRAYRWGPPGVGVLVVHGVTGLVDPSLVLVVAGGAVWTRRLLRHGPPADDRPAGPGTPEPATVIDAPFRELPPGGGEPW